MWSMCWQRTKTTIHFNLNCFIQDNVLVSGWKFIYLFLHTKFSTLKSTIFGLLNFLPKFLNFPENFHRQTASKTAQTLQISYSTTSPATIQRTRLHFQHNFSTIGKCVCYLHEIFGEQQKTIQLLKFGNFWTFENSWKKCLLMLLDAWIRQFRATGLFGHGFNSNLILQIFNSF